MDNIITDPSTLSLQNNYRDDIYVFGEDENRNKSLCHAAYHQFTLWRYQYLGANNRRVIPSCCVASLHLQSKTLKSGSQLPKKYIFICFNENLLNLMKNAFYFILKGLFVLKIFEFLS